MNSEGYFFFTQLNCLNVLYLNIYPALMTCCFLLFLCSVKLNYTYIPQKEDEILKARWQGEKIIIDNSEEKPSLKLFFMYS